MAPRTTKAVLERMDDGRFKVVGVQLDPEGKQDLWDVFHPWGTRVYVEVNRDDPQGKEMVWVTIRGDTVQDSFTRLVFVKEARQPA